jgi:hypothetical protein
MCIIYLFLISCNQHSVCDHRQSSRHSPCAPDARLGPRPRCADSVYDTRPKQISDVGSVRADNIDAGVLIHGKASRTVTDFIVFTIALPACRNAAQ